MRKGRDVRLQQLESVTESGRREYLRTMVDLNVHRQLVLIERREKYLVTEKRSKKSNQCRKVTRTKLKKSTMQPQRKVTSKLKLMETRKKQIVSVAVMSMSSGTSRNGEGHPIPTSSEVFPTRALIDQDP